MRTVIGTGDPGIPSPDRDTRLILTAHGAYGRSYVDPTKKLLDVWIVRGPITNEQVLFKHTYKFTGADLWGDAHWSSTDRVALTVYDYPRDANKKLTPSNHIATLCFELSGTSGRFEQKP